MSEHLLEREPVVLRKSRATFFDGEAALVQPGCVFAVRFIKKPRARTFTAPAGAVVHKGCAGQMRCFQLCVLARARAGLGRPARQRAQGDVAHRRGQRRRGAAHD